MTKSRFFAARIKGVRRGGAMVEMVVLMLAFLPMILIPLYLQDGLIYKMTVQERVYSTAWDFAYGNYETRNISSHAGSILSANEDIFKNGKSGNTREKHTPASPWSDFRWPSNPVSCTGDTDFLSPNMMAGPLAMQFHNEYTKGGKVECSGRIEVANHYVPHKVDMLTFKRDKDFFRPQDEFIEYNDGGEPFRFGLLVDPWTIHKPNDIVNNKGNDAFRERTEFCWEKSSFSRITFEVFEALWLVYVGKLVGSQILSPIFLAPMSNYVDYPPRPMDISSVHPVSEYNESRETAWGPEDFYVSPFKDGVDDMYESTFNARKQMYLGCEGSLDDGNCD